MESLQMKKQDLVELYQLCRVYVQAHDGAGRAAAEKLMQAADAEYLGMGYGHIVTAGNPRGAGRKAVYPDETNRKIQALHAQGMSKRRIAKEIGCSLGHVQDVTKAAKAMVYGN